MAQKAKAVFVCAECGSESPKWYGKCPSCGQWNTMNEEVRAPQRAAAPAGASSAVRGAAPADWGHQPRGGSSGIKPA